MAGWKSLNRSTVSGRIPCFAKSSDSASRRPADSATKQTALILSINALSLVAGWSAFASNVTSGSGRMRGCVEFGSLISIELKRFRSANNSSVRTKSFSGERRGFLRSCLKFSKRTVTSVQNCSSAWCSAPTRTVCVSAGKYSKRVAISLKKRGA